MAKRKYSRSSLSSTVPHLPFCLVGLFLFVFISTMSPCQAIGATPPPKAPTRVVYGFDREFPPFTFEEAGGIATGFEAELVRAIFAEEDAELVFRPLQWDLVPLELSSGTIDITSGIVKTEQRTKLYLFSDAPTFSLQIRLFTKVYNRFPTANFLRGQPVSVEQGTYQHRLLEDFGGINLKPYKGRIDGLKALYNDEVAAYCGPVQNTYYYINKLNYGAITTIATPLGFTEMRIAVNRERGDILRMVNRGLTRIIENGEYDRLYRKWFVRELNDAEINAMLQAAASAAIPSYVPYGNNAYGAAVLTATGNIYTACTVENADLPLTISALNGAVSRTISNGEFEFRAALIVDSQGSIVVPTPEELQLLYEFGRGILVFMGKDSTGYTVKMISEVLSDPVIKISPTIKNE